MCLGQLKKQYSVYVDITFDKSEKVHFGAIEAKVISYNLNPSERKFYGLKLEVKQDKKNKSLVIRCLGKKIRIVALLTIFFEIY